MRTRDWIGELVGRPREQALAELARRYLRGYAPASERDLARWAGLPLRDSRLAFERIAAELREVEVDGVRPWALADGVPRAPRSPLVRLLGAFDNFNMGYEDREFALPEAHLKQVLPGGGIVRPTITVDGRIVGTWRSKRAGKRLSVQLEPFAALKPSWEAIGAEIEDIGRFEELSVTLG